MLSDLDLKHACSVVGRRPVGIHEVLRSIMSSGVLAPAFRLLRGLVSSHRYEENLSMSHMLT